VWSYSGDPATSPNDAVRFWIGDTTETTPQLSDEEIAYLLSLTGGNVLQAAIAACVQLANRYSSQVDFAVETELRVQLSQRAEAYAKRAQELRDQAQLLGFGGLVPMPYAGGISRSDMQRQEQDADRVPPGFVVGIMSAPGTDPARRLTPEEEE
jgi:hypothetical protein